MLCSKPVISVVNLNWTLQNLNCRNGKVGGEHNEMIYIPAIYSIIHILLSISEKILAHDSRNAKGSRGKIARLSCSINYRFCL